jgi:hypothetical protein
MLVTVQAKIFQKKVYNPLLGYQNSGSTPTGPGLISSLLLITLGQDTSTMKWRRPKEEIIYLTIHIFHAS